MLTIIFSEFKRWWLGETKEEIDEIVRLESKHTRVRFDADIYELIRIQ
ncbi:hypothetical protein [Gottfriedia luciferensis]|nr:hypothetical protein [Gottfriedia luciferensis]